MAAEGPMYQTDDEKYGALLGNLLNPPAEGVQATGPSRPQPTEVPSPRPAAPALAQVSSPTLTTMSQPKPSVPAAVSASGDSSTASLAPKTWADYVRQSNDRSLQSLNQSQQATQSLLNTPTVTTTNAPLEQRRQALVAPIPYRDPTTGKVMTSAVDPVTGQTIDPSKLYKPGIGTRIVRGIDAVRRGGVLGAFDPNDVGGTAYGAPNKNYQLAEQLRQGQAGALQQQEERNLANEKADSERLKDIGTETRATATGFKDVAGTATAQQNAENKDELAQVRQQLADQAGVPKTYEQAVIASHDPSLPPEKRQQYQQAAKDIQQAEVRKFAYAQRATGGPNDDARQPMIDAATAEVNKLNTYGFNPHANRGAGAFYDPSAPNKLYSPSEFTAMKNQIASKLDKDLAAKKLRPLGVRFDVKSTTPGTAQTQPSTTPAPPKQQSAANPSGMQVSLAQARALPINNGKTDAQITADIQSHGHMVVP